MYEETCAFTEEEMKRLEEASDEWNICREKTGQIWEFFFDDDEYDDTDDDDLIPYIVIKVAHLYGFQGSWNVIPRMLAKIIDGIPI